MFAALIALNAPVSAQASIAVVSDYTQVSAPPSGANGAPWLFGAAWPREAAPFGFCWVAGDARNADGSAGAGVIYHDWDNANACGTSAWTKDTLPLGSADFGFASISCPGPGLCVAVGGARTVVRNSHANSNSTSWSVTNRSAGQDLYGVSCADARHCVTVGSNGTVLYSTDGGLTFATGSSGTGHHLFGVFCSAATLCIATGASGTTIRSTDMGANWTSATSGTAVAVDAGSCYSISCYAAGDSPGGGLPGYLAFSTTGGTTWTPATTNPSTATLFGVDCRNQNDCSAASANGQIVTTHNGGSVWVQSSMSPTTALQLDAVGCSLTAVKCIVVGQGGLVYRG
jgi:photosystem II stability/assembly factor-like uncharacterized protein